MNEIDLDGQVVHLTSLEEDIPNEKEEPITADLVIDDVDATGSRCLGQYIFFFFFFYDLISVSETPVAELEYPLDSEEKWRQLSLLLKRNKKEDSIRMIVRYFCIFHIVIMFEYF